VNETVELTVRKQQKPGELQVRWSCSRGHGRSALRRLRRRSTRGDKFYLDISHLLLL